jgi:transcriptional regulator with XRE-family HTH domain
MFNDILRKTRENAGYSQKQVADLLNIPDTTYRNYENTSREPDFNTLLKIAEIFNVSVDYLLGKTNIRNYANSNDSIDVGNLSPTGKEKAKDYVAMLETIDKLKPKEQPEDIHKNA